MDGRRIFPINGTGTQPAAKAYALPASIDLRNVCPVVDQGELVAAVNAIAGALQFDR
jgi:hypothetical protein